MIEKVIIFGAKLYNSGSYINFGFFNAFEEKDYDVYWIHNKNISQMDNLDLSKNTLFIINNKLNNDKIPVSKKNYYVIINGDDKYFRSIDKQKVFIKEYSTDLDLSKYTKLEDYIYVYKRKRILVMPYATLLTPTQIIDNLNDFVKIKDRDRKIVYVGNYNQQILNRVNNSKFLSKRTIIKRLIELDDEVELIRNNLLSCTYTKKSTAIDMKTLTHITYGTICITDSDITVEFLNNKIIKFNQIKFIRKNPKLLLTFIKKQNIFELIELIANKHTFLNRISTIFQYFGI
jgi:hypothetical protein